MAEKREMAKWQTPKFNIRPEILKLFFFLSRDGAVSGVEGSDLTCVISARIAANPPASHKKKRLPYRIRLDTASRSAFVCALVENNFSYFASPFGAPSPLVLEKCAFTSQEAKIYKYDNSWGELRRFWYSGVVDKRGWCCSGFCIHIRFYFWGTQKKAKWRWEEERNIVEFWFMCFESKRKSIMCVYAWHCKYCFVLQPSDWIRRIWD